MTLSLSTYATAKGEWAVGELPEGADAFILGAAARKRGGLSVMVARDDSRAASFKSAAAFFAPDVKILELPAWDCLPYDRISPSRMISARRAHTLHHLARRREQGFKQPYILVTTINAAAQKLPPPDIMASGGLSLRLGRIYARERLQQYLSENGFARAATVIEPGDYALRGDLVDIFPPGRRQPLRLEFFGDELESMRWFDPETQRSAAAVARMTLSPVSELFLNEQTIGNFRRAYTRTFGGGLSADPVYAAVKAGIRYQGLEHWLPLLYPSMAPLSEYLPQETLWAFDALAGEAHTERSQLIADYYQARADLAGQKDASYRPMPPEDLYLSGDELAASIKEQPVRRHSQFTLPVADAVMNMGGVGSRNFSQERQTEGMNVFAAAADHIRVLAGEKKKVLVAAWSPGASERLGGVLADQELITGEISGAEMPAMQPGQIKRALLTIENGFSIGDFAVISEQDILGDRLVRRGRRGKAKNFIAEASSLAAGDLVIHIDHGLGRYLGLETLSVQSAPHDCLKLEYAGGGTLYLPVENIELLSRYGAGGENPVLDRLGSAAWQSRKSKAKQRLKDMAAELIKIAAARALRRCPPVDVADSALAEFSARFPYVETDDQMRAIDDVIGDLRRGTPMDRLICGDVGFGKTEVAMRAAFMAAMSGQQVAIVAPTTILSRQHFATVSERFRGLPIKVRQLSRLVSPALARTAKEEISNGQCDIVIGTHALLAKTINFKDLGLLIIDEEQRFGVRHKERLKAMKAHVHVLTLTATPIPRTLQMSLSGIRDLSLIATPPVDRLAVRTYITPFDQVVLREAILREKYRGGQSFFVMPRIADIRRCEEFLREHVPEVNYVIAHGQMAPGALEDVMTAFYDRQYDVLLSTSIIESGIDIPSANTMIIYRADRFGLAQLYQMRGRVGRSKTRAYAYLTTPEGNAMTPGAMQRLKILQSLDTLGAGFSLASHDLDMRGGGNPLGEEQSGHIKDLGVELYQHMLEEAVAELRNDDQISRNWSPQINTGVPILIPESYVTDLNVRLSLYRRLSELDNDETAAEFRAELIDRFGPLPFEVKNLLQVTSIKRLARRASVAKIDAGPKGATFAFRHDDIKDPRFIVSALAAQPNWKIRPDQTLLVRGRLEDAKERLNAVEHALGILTRAGE